MFAGLHKGADALDEGEAEFGQEAALLSAVGAEYLVHLPEQYTDQHTGAATQGRRPRPRAVEEPRHRHGRARQVPLKEHGVKLVFHPHADTHVDTQERIERFLTDTDPELVNLCLDTGHVSYCEGDNIEIIERFPERITYVHLKSVDPVVRARALAEKMPLAEAVKLGIMCEPPYGEPDMPPLLDALGRLDREIYTVIEQDLYPVEPHIPLPIGARTAGYYVGCGLGPGPALALLTVRDSTRNQQQKERHDTRVGVIGTGMIGQDHIRRLTAGGLRRRGGGGHRRQRAAWPRRSRRGCPTPPCTPPVRSSSPTTASTPCIVCSWGPTHEEYVVAVDRGRQAGVLREAAGHHPGGVPQHHRRRGGARQPAGAGRVHAALRRGLPRAEAGRSTRAQSARR